MLLLELAWNGSSAPVDKPLEAPSSSDSTRTPTTHADACMWAIASATASATRDDTRAGPSTRTRARKPREASERSAPKRQLYTVASLVAELPPTTGSETERVRIARVVACPDLAVRALRMLPRNQAARTVSGPLRALAHVNQRIFELDPVDDEEEAHARHAHVTRPIASHLTEGLPDSSTEPLVWGPAPRSGGVLVETVKREGRRAAQKFLGDERARALYPALFAMRALPRSAARGDSCCGLASSVRARRVSEEPARQVLAEEKYPDVFGSLCPDGWRGINKLNAFYQTVVLAEADGLWLESSVKKCKLPRKATIDGEVDASDQATYGWCTRVGAGTKWANIVVQVMQEMASLPTGLLELHTSRQAVIFEWQAEATLAIPPVITFPTSSEVQDFRDMQLLDVSPEFWLEVEDRIICPQSALLAACGLYALSRDSLHPRLQIS